MTAPPTDKPTPTRYVLALWLCGLSGVLYLDRICMSQAVDPISRDLKLTNTQMSYVLMAFSVAYGLFEIPTGRMGDRFGSRLVLVRIAVWWSVFTALTGAAWGLVSLLVLRFLFGAGEAGAYPNTARVISRWFPLTERGRVQGLIIASAQVGAMLAPVGAAYLIEAVGWRWTFAVFGGLGVVWAVGFWIWFRDDPARHPGVRDEELREIRGGQPPPAADPGPIPWSAVLTNRGILVLSGIMILAAFFSYFFYSWYQKYLTDARGVENVDTGWMASIVLAGALVGVLFGGWLADRVPVWFADTVRARRYVGVVGYLTGAGCLYIGLQCDNPWTLAVLWGCASLAMHVTLPNWWSVAIPQSGRHVGALFGMMNGLGVLGALTSQWFVGAFSDWRGAQGYTGREQWDPLFDVYVVVLLLGAAGWWLYRHRPLPEPEEPTT